MDELLSLSYLLNHVKRAISINYQAPVWVIAEIAQVSFNKGNIYLNLIEKTEYTNDLLAKTEATLWKSKTQKYQLDILFDVFKVGNKILIKCTPELHEIYGLKLNIEEFDEQYTIGLLQLELEKTRQKLIQEKLWDKNRTLNLPLVIKKIAILSSSKAAGYQDFIHQLEHNNFGYKFEIQLFETSVQGDSAKIELVDNLKIIEKEDIKFDCIVIVRGGGAKMDLQVFNEYEVCRQIGLSSYPILVGIGHEIDETISDQIANNSLKTPTAVAEFIIQNNLKFETQIFNVYQNIDEAIKQKINNYQNKLNYLESDITWRLKNIIKSSLFEIEILAKNIKTLEQNIINQKLQNLLILEESLMQFNWKNNLKKGYFLIENIKNKRITSINQVLLEKKIKIIGKDGDQKFSIDPIEN